MDVFGYKKHVAEACNAIREELDDHLSAINENSRDVADVRELVGALDEKLEKLSARIDELYLLLGAEQSLTQTELALQTFLQTPRTIEEIAGFCQDSTAAADRLLRCLHFKGVHVYSTVDHDVTVFTTNRESVKHISLNNYF
jgi:hypothetical protein